MNNPAIKVNNSKTRARLLSMTAMFAALVTVTTAFIKIPSPFGYSHAGDSMIYLGASILPGPYGIIAASIGGFLADIISGYAQFSVATAIIKALNAVPFVVCCYFMKSHNKADKIISLPNLLMLIPTTIITVFGYFVANYLLYGLGAAITELSLWWLQPTVGAVIFIALGTGLDAIKFKQKILPRR